MKNNKGFSMVELLAVIVILGLLSTFAIVSVSAILNKSEKNHYKTQEKEMVMAAKTYASDNKNVLPKNIGEKRVIDLSELQGARYLGKVVDRSKRECINGQVTIFKYSDNDYSYKAELECPKYNSMDSDNGEDGPKITLNINTNYNTASFTYKIEAIDSDKKIIGYSYLIYKHGVLVYDSGSKSASKVGKIDTKTVSLKDYVPGKFEIVFKATDIYGATSSKTVGDEIVSEFTPECGNTNPTYTEANWRRYDTPQVVNIKCVDNNSGCAREDFSQSFNFDTGINYIEIVNNAGIKNSCPVGVYIDNTKPSTPVIHNPYENTWINKSYTVTIDTVDATAGIKEIQYRYPNSNDPAEREWKAYPNSSKKPGDTSAFTSTPFTKERSEYVEIRSCDYAGNCSDSARSMIKIDKTAPTCAITRNIASPNGKNGWYISNVIMNMSVTDNTSGVATAVKSPIHYELTTAGTPVYTKMNLSETQTEIKNPVVWKGYIKDDAGNVSSCADISGIKIDTTPPVCSFNMGSNVTFKTVDDPVSGINSAGISKVAATSYGVTSLPISTGTFYGYLLDNAGNASTCQTSVTNTYSHSYDCNPHNCNGYKCNCYWDCTITDQTGNSNGNIYCPGGYEKCSTCYHTCYDTCTEHLCNDGYHKLNNTYCYK